MFLDRPKQSKNPKYMLVHCTHGHNRTGFMIIHYLMRTHISCVAEVGILDPRCYLIDSILWYYINIFFLGNKYICSKAATWHIQEGLH
jgi:hypothetical protein